MPTTRAPHPLEFPQRPVGPLRTAWTRAELARQFEPPAQAVPNPVRQAVGHEDRRQDSLATTEPDERRRFPRSKRTLSEPCVARAPAVGARRC